MKPLPHQIEVAEKAAQIFKKLGYVYINGQPRSGKTLTSLLVMEQCNVNRVLILTKKQAIPGWLKFITSSLKKEYQVTNYEQLGKLNMTAIHFRFNPKDFDAVIIDESHNIGAYPQPSTRWRIIRAFCKDLPHIHLSGTPIIESANTIFHQMNISKYTPFPFTNFYKFYQEYGFYTANGTIPQKRIAGGFINDYTRCNNKLLEKIKEFTVYMSQQMAGINVQVEDKLHYIELGVTTRNYYNKVVKDRVLELKHNICVCDTTLKLRTTLHMIEGGTLKFNDGTTTTIPAATEKINYILKHFGDKESVGIMCHFIAERALLAKHFKKAKLFSSNAHAEGVDLSHLKHFIIYSSDYSGAKFVQRRERIANINGSNTNTVHHLLVKGAISEQVYNMVSKKRDFNNETFVLEGLGDGSEV